MPLYSYQTTYASEAAFLLVTLLALLAMFPLGIWFKVYLRMRFFPALLLGFGTIVAAAAKLAVRQGEVLMNSPLRNSGEQFGLWRGNGMLVDWAYFIAAGLAMGVAAKAYRAWVMDIATDAERRPDKSGVRAWLDSMGIISVLGSGLCAFIAMGWPIVGTVAGLLMVLLSYPVANLVMASGQEEGGDTVGAEERQRVLAMVEAGKINGEEAAELIGALAEKPAVGATQGVRMTANRRMLLLGAGLVVVGFCLPWFSINLGDAAADALLSVQQAMPASVPLPPGYAVPQMQTVLVERGGDIGHGLGWVILACGLIAGTLPLWWPGRAGAEAQKPVALGSLLVGSVVLVYLLSGMVAWSNVGLWLTVGAFGILWVGVLREYVRVVGMRRVVTSG